MLLTRLKLALLLLPIVQLCGTASGNTHTFGQHGIDANLMLSKELFSQDASADTEPARNYTVVFKLLDQMPHASVTRVELIVPGFVRI